MHYNHEERKEQIEKAEEKERSRKEKEEKEKKEAEDKIKFEEETKQEKSEVLEKEDGEDEPTDITYDDKIGSLQDSPSDQVTLLSVSSPFVLIFFMCYIHQFLCMILCSN